MSDAAGNLCCLPHDLVAVYVGNCSGLGSSSKSQGATSLCDGILRDADTTDEEGLCDTASENGAAKTVGRPVSDAAT